jgi:hypothetical protein
MLILLKNILHFSSVKNIVWRDICRKRLEAIVPFVGTGHVALFCAILSKVNL